MKYIVKIETCVVDTVLKKIKEVGKVICRLPSVPEGQTALIETDSPKVVENLPGVISFGPNRNATV